MSAPPTSEPVTPDPADPNPLNTRHRILEAATELFAEHGFDNVSLRQITRAADANLAAVNYHFGSKHNLTAEVIASRVNPINRQRIDLLTSAEHLADGDPVPLKAIVRAFLTPMFSFLTSDPQTSAMNLKLMGRCMSQRDLPMTDSSLPLFREVTRRYPAAVKRTLPDVPDEVIQWRLLFSVGVVAHAMLHADLLDLITEGASRRLDADAVMQQAVDFCAAGLRATWQPS